MTTPRLRMARITSPKVANLEGIRRYLPDNYSLSETDSGDLLIYGYDNAGWTLDEYVIPRLASGLIFAEEETGGESVGKLLIEIDRLREIVKIANDRLTPIYAPLAAVGGIYDNPEMMAVLGRALGVDVEDLIPVDEAS